MLNFHRTLHGSGLNPVVLDQEHPLTLNCHLILYHTVNAVRIQSSTSVTEQVHYFISQSNTMLKRIAMKHTALQPVFFVVGESEG